MPSGVLPGVSPQVVFNAIRYLAKGFLTRQHTPSPFFDSATGKPVVALEGTRGTILIGTLRTARATQALRDIAARNERLYSLTAPHLAAAGDLAAQAFALAELTRELAQARSPIAMSTGGSTAWRTRAC